MTYFRKVPNVNSTVLSNGFILHLALSEYNTSAILNGHFAELMANNSSMEGPPLSCFHLPDPSFDHVSERYTMNLITAIINIVTASLAVICNLLICAAIIIRLRTPSNLLIASLALSDVFVVLLFSRVTSCTESWKISVVPFPALSEFCMQMLSTFVMEWPL